jgi:hypothetical protein
VAHAVAKHRRGRSDAASDRRAGETLPLEGVDHLAQVLDAHVGRSRARAECRDDVVPEPLPVQLHGAVAETAESAFLAFEEARRKRGDGEAAIAGLDVAAVELDAAVAALEGEQEPEPEPPILDAVAAAQAAQKRALVDALTGRSARPSPEASSGSLDGGARQTPPAKPETHEQMLARVLRSGEADAGASL